MSLKAEVLEAVRTRGRQQGGKQEIYELVCENRLNMARNRLPGHPHMTAIFVAFAYMTLPTNWSVRRALRSLKKEHPHLCRRKKRREWEIQRDWASQI